MIIGAIGRFGSGKSLGVSMLASYLARECDLPLYANYSLRNAERLRSMDQVQGVFKGVMVLDEVHNFLDSRMWSDNSKRTQWLLQLRKHDLLLFWISQHMNQVDMRLRQNTDFLVFFEKRERKVFFTFIDYHYGDIGKRFEIAKPSNYYWLYDFKEILKPLV